WFKNLMIYRLTKALDWTADSLQTALQQCEYHPCQQSDMSKFGWTNPLRGTEMLHFSVGKQILLLAHKEEKILPAHVVKAELEQRIELLEQKENRKLKKVEKQALKDDVVSMLLPRAFSKNQQTALWIDTENQLIYVDAASSKRAINENPTWLTLLEEVELLGTTESGLIKCKNQDLNSAEIETMLESDKVITKLSLEWEDNLSFILCEDGTLKRLKFADDVLEKNDDILKEDIAQRFDADFILMTSVLSELTEMLLDEFDGEKETV
ncbi:recombination-associated protein RdgC, partial [Pasteurella multocida]|uniref:recombination-associated protein RdgC n=1 Tax=Pasteurella multocida TaxID=747 RepID=UPI0020212D55